MGERSSFHWFICRHMLARRSLIKMHIPFCHNIFSGLDCDMHLVLGDTKVNLSDLLLHFCCHDLHVTKVSRVKGFRPVLPHTMDPTNLYIKGLPSNADELLAIHISRLLGSQFQVVPFQNLEHHSLVRQNVWPINHRWSKRWSNRSNKCSMISMT